MKGYEGALHDCSDVFDYYDCRQRYYYGEVEKTNLPLICFRTNCCLKLLGHFSVFDLDEKMMFVSKSKKYM